MNTAELFLIAMLIIPAAPYLVWRLLRTDGYVPLVVVQIIGGILRGPRVPGVKSQEVSVAFVDQPLNRACASEA